ncbi:MAG: hypothetical protein EOO63_05995 [Hymenobacter sp.]|nr:MAG: hypothetical protein EOO63_05995 [Hymenobacter sp.]
MKKPESKSLSGCIWSILLVCGCSLGGLLWLVLPDRLAGASFPISRQANTWLEITVSSELGSLLSEYNDSYSTVKVYYVQLGGWRQQSKRVLLDSVRVAGIHSDSEVSFNRQKGDTLAPIHVLLPDSNVFKFVPSANFSIRKKGKLSVQYFPD